MDARAFPMSVHPRIDFDPTVLLVVALLVPVVSAVAAFWPGIVLGLLFAALLWVLRTVRRDSGLVLEDGALVIRMGVLLRQRIPFARIAGAERAEHRYVQGLGLRHLGPAFVGVLLDTRDVVDIRLREPTPVRLLPGWRVAAERIRTSPRGADEFLAALRARLDVVGP